MTIGRLVGASEELAVELRGGGMEGILGEKEGGLGACHRQSCSAGRKTRLTSFISAGGQCNLVCVVRVGGCGGVRGDGVVGGRGGHVFPSEEGML